MPIKDDGVLDVMFQGTIAFFYFVKEVSQHDDRAGALWVQGL